MVKKIFSLLNKEFGVNEAALILGSFALLSQILGLFRDRALAHYLGPSTQLDIYYAAFRIPDFLYISIASLASITILLPFLLERMGDVADPTYIRARKFFSDVFTVFLVAIALASLVIAIFMPRIAPLIAPGFSPESLAELVTVSRIMLFSPILLGASNILGSVTQMLNKFFVYSLSPVFYNLGILLGIFFLYPTFGVNGLALGVVLGGLLHLCIQLPVLLSNTFFPKFSWKINWLDIKNVVMLSLPRTLGLSLSNISILVLISLISKLGEGAISMFTFSYNLQSVPIGIIGISYSVASFPTLVRFFTTNERGLFVDHILEASKKIIFWSLPVVFLFIVLRAQIVRVILGTGSFSWTHTRITAAALALFSLSLVAQSLVHLFVRGYYAAGNTKKPLLINLFSAIVTISSAYGLIYVFNNFPAFQYFVENLLRVEGLPETQVLMLPLAYSFGTILNFTLLWILFHRDFCKKATIKISRVFFQSFAGAFFMGYISYICLDIFDTVFSMDTFWGVLGQGVVSGIIGICAGIFVLYILKSVELREIWHSVHAKFWKTPIIAPEQADL